MSKKLHKSRKSWQLIGAYDHLMFHLMTALSLCSLTEIRSSRCNLTTVLCLCALKTNPNPQRDRDNLPGPFPTADWNACYRLILWQSVSHNLLSGSLDLQTRREPLKKTNQTKMHQTWKIYRNPLNEGRIWQNISHYTNQVL